MRILIRHEQPADIPAIRSVHESAFPTHVEARLVDLLRDHGKATVSLVAELNGTVVGHILFSPVTLESAPPLGGLGLGPVAVSPDHQRLGIGARLIEAGIAECRRLDCPFIVVLGEPEYYHRFGFTRAGGLGLTNEYGVDEPFMVLVLNPDALASASGLVRYAEEFAHVDAEPERSTGGVQCGGLESQGPPG